jgi:hypothetical protein
MILVDAIAVTATIAWYRMTSVAMNGPLMLLPPSYDIADQVDDSHREHELEGG